MHPETTSPAPIPQAASEPGSAPQVDSRTLFTGGRNEVEIHHNGRVYRLRCTRLGKLILTA